MSKVFFLLATIFGGIALGGLVWSVVAAGRASKQTTAADDAGAGRGGVGTDKQAEAEAAGLHPGTAKQGVGGWGYSGAEIGCQVRRQGWRRAAPNLLVAGALLLLLLSTALALLASLPGKAFGLAALGIALYVSISELRAFSIAIRGR